MGNICINTNAQNDNIIIMYQVCGIALVLVLPESYHPVINILLSTPLFLNYCLLEGGRSVMYQLNCLSCFICSICY